MANITIPQGKILRLRKNKESVTGDIPIILEEDITISLNSQFSALLDSGVVNKLGTLLGGLSRDLLNFGGSGQFKQMGFQIWEKTDPVMISGINIGFYMGSTYANDAYVEVYKPAIALMKLPLPDDSNISGSSGVRGIGLVPPGPSILEALGGENVRTGKNVSLEIGKVLRLPKVIVKKAEPTFSTETDENGYPIWCKIVLDIISLFTATTQTIDPTQATLLEQ